MKRSYLGALLLLVACGDPDLEVDPAVRDDWGLGDEAKADSIACPPTPTVGPRGAWRHSLTSPTVTLLGSPRHRGIDLITSSSAAVQHIRGEISYGVADKALEDEDIQLFACVNAAWRALGTARTDDEGAFDLTLSGGGRLPVGQRPLFASVIGDRSSVSFLGLVAPAGTRIFVSDVDGTLTSSESAYTESLVTGAQVAAHAGAAQAWQGVRQRGDYPVYLTSRGRVFTAGTRRWLADRGFPAGPVRLAPQLLTFPGDSTVDYKARALGDITSSGLTLGVGVGNRKSDIQAYQRAGLPAARILIKRPEYDSETTPLISSGAAQGFADYRAVKIP